jgi:hypothetical protein
MSLQCSFDLYNDESAVAENLGQASRARPNDLLVLYVFLTPYSTFSVHTTSAKGALAVYCAGAVSNRA